MKRPIRHRFILPSTRRFADEALQTPHYSLANFLHGYVYIRWPYLYIGTATGEHPFARVFTPISNLTRWLERLLHRQGHANADGTAGRVTFADTYHGKAVPLGEATHLVCVQQDIQLRNLEQVIPYARARDIVLKNPDHIVALECPCRASRPNPCKPLDVCLIIGEPFAGFIAEHHPDRSRWITQAEAVEILRAEDERGHVHHAFFKDAMLNRFYAICNCCHCCCGAMQAHRNGTPMLASSGYASRVDESICVGCGECNNFCQFGALHLQDGRNAVDGSACMGCGVCVSKCAHGALSLRRDPSKGAPLEILSLLESAALDRERC